MSLSAPSVSDSSVQEQCIYCGNSAIIASVDDFSFAKTRVELCSLKIKKVFWIKNHPYTISENWC